MRALSFDEIYHRGKPLCDCLIKDGMSLSNALEIYCSLHKDLLKQTSLREVRLQEMGIDDGCNLTYENLLTEILNALHGTDVDLRKEMALINKSINNILASTTTATDEKVKASQTDPQPGFLDAKVKTLQPGSIAYEAGQLTFVGFVPVGAMFFISRARLGDLDATGKGKSGTDLWGYALCNGQNGTTNRLGMGHPRYVAADQLQSAGNTGGQKEIAVKKENIETFSVPVTGTINEFGNTNQAELRFNTNKIKDGSGGDTWLMRIGDGQTGSNTVRTLPFSFTHTHGFTLTATHSNPNPTKIPLVPEHMLEIPIERINP